MSKAFVIGTGLRRFGKFPTTSHRDFGWPVVREALLESGVAPRRVDVVYASSVFGGSLMGQQILGKVGLDSVPVLNVENACSSSASGLHEAAARIAAGQIDCALVIGIDMLTKLGTGPLPLNVDDWDASQGLTMPNVYAMRAQRYLHEHGLDASVFSEVTVKARRHGALNPLAQFQKPVTLEEVEASREVADPLKLLHCCPTGDGAACVVLASGKVAAQARANAPVEIVTTVLHSGTYHADPISMVKSHVSSLSASEAYEAAGIGPSDLDVLEFHDSFSIAELMYYEAFQLCEPGGAVALLRSGATSLGGRSVVNPSGGLLSRGHPVAASGVAQICEITRQLQGRAGRHQVEKARLGLAHVTGGGISGFEHGACAVTILKR